MINNMISYRSTQSCSILYNNKYEINYETTCYYMYDDNKYDKQYDIYEVHKILYDNKYEINYEIKYYYIYTQQIQ